MSHQKELGALTGLRAIAAFWVVFHHYFEIFVVLIPPLLVLKPLAQSGYIGVELFFTLSGFIISLNYLDRFRRFSTREYANFLWLRLARIYPAYLATLLGLLALVLIGRHLGIPFNRDDADLYSPQGFWASVLMVQAWGNGEAVWNVVGWSVSAEWFAYLCFPLVALLLWRIRTPWQALLTAALVLAVCLALHLSGWLGEFFPFTFVNLLRITGSFVAGALMYWLYREQVARGWNWNFLTPLLSLGLPVAACLLVLAGLTPFLTSFMMPPLILGLAYSQGAVARLLAGCVLLYWGAVSYALYLTHFIVRMSLSKVLSPERLAGTPLLLRAGVLMIYLLVAGLVGIALYHLIEEPGRRWMRRWRPGSRKASALKDRNS
ncbi:acyltransferase [Deinococcus sp. S9]|uniref:acyltransferase family protein n=1 Tax=Deinococcus sp. S9 TaxID=2545754 RepID=UPI0010569397|nr:acyltransferase [Deinococcus sp. S9]TDE87080.1 acyltransferase [Deinococcus sp. S9]